MSKWRSPPLLVERLSGRGFDPCPWQWQLPRDGLAVVARAPPACRSLGLRGFGGSANGSRELGGSLCITLASSRRTTGPGTPQTYMPNARGPRALHRGLGSNRGYPMRSFNRVDLK